MIKTCVDEVSIVFCVVVVAPIVLVFWRESDGEIFVALRVFFEDESDEFPVAGSVVGSDVFRFTKIHRSLDGSGMLWKECCSHYSCRVVGGAG